MSTAANQGDPQKQRTLRTVGSEAWQAENWRNQWHTLAEAITETANQIQTERTLSMQTPAADEAKEPTQLKLEKEGLYKTLRALYKGSPAEMAEAKALTQSFLVNYEAGEEAAIITQYYLPATIEKELALLGRLRDFADLLFHFFCEGFYPDHTQSQPANAEPTEPKVALAQLSNALFFSSAHYTANYVVGCLLEQISLDLNIIHQAFQQRQMSCLRAKLFVADRFASLALKPAIDNGFLDRRFTAVLCYLNKRVEIRLLPYDELIFIGIPLTANVKLKTGKMGDPFYVSTDYLAIPHEIGHYLFQYGQSSVSPEQRDGDDQAKRPLAKIVQGRLRAELAKQPGRLQHSQWIFVWLEELFADAYGCLVAGPVSVVGFLQVLATGLPSHLQEESDHYPFAVLRPLIQTQILRAITDHAGNPLYHDEADQLDAHWQQWVKEHWSHWVDQHWPYGYGNQTDILGEASYIIAGQTLTGREILAQLQEAIAVILRILNRLCPPDMGATWTPHWEAAQFPDAQKVTQLLNHFKNFAVEEGILALVRALPTDESTDLPAPTRPPFAWLSEQIAQLQRDRFVKPGFDRLVEALLFEGWSTEGPRGGHIRGG